MVRSEKYTSKRFTVEKLVDDEDGIVVNVFVGNIDFFIKEVEQENHSLNREEVIDLCVEKVLLYVDKLAYGKKPIIINNIDKHITDWSDFTYEYSEKVCNKNVFTFNLNILREQHSGRKPFILKFIEEYNKGVN